MKYKLKVFGLSLAVMIIHFTCYGQDNYVWVSREIKVVPEGKQWILEKGQQIEIKTTNGIYKDGSFCNQTFFHSPGFIFGIGLGNYDESKSYGIYFDSNSIVKNSSNSIIIKPISFIEFNQDNLNRIKDQGIIDGGKDKLVFKSGETVFIGSCLQGIQMKELPLSRKELTKIKNEKDLLLSKMNIPYNGNKSLVKDALINEIKLESGGVVWHRGGGAGLDENTWTISINGDKVDVEQQSSNLHKSYVISDIFYDEVLGMQKFILGEDKKSTSHHLWIAWSKESDHYIVILNSIDKSEQFQFQETISTKIKYQ